MGAWDNLRKFKESWGWLKFIWDMLGLLGVAGFAAGLGASVGGAVWARMSGVPLPLVLMAAYCTFVGAVYLAMAPAIIKTLSVAQTPLPIKGTNKPNYAAVKLIHRFTIGDAARLWCDIDQNAKGTYESVAWQEAFIAAVERGDLDFIPKSEDRRMQEYEKSRPDSSTIISRESLQEFAAANGQNPKFLRDD